MNIHTLQSQLNWLRAAVLGANDGIVSVAAIIVGVAGATQHKSVIITAGIAGLTAGALSMAAGEYVSVSSQRDTERTKMKKKKDELTNPWHAALASAAAFLVGASIPLLFVIISPDHLIILATFIASLIALVITGAASGYFSGANIYRAIIRVVLGGAVAMFVTLFIGHTIGTSALY